MEEGENYRKRNFISLDGVSQLLYCSICSDIFDDPIGLKECGHTFCKKCINDWSRKNNICPNCRTEFNLEKMKKDYIAFNIINDLEVYCSNKNCPWKGKLKDLNIHLEQCNFDPIKMDDFMKDILNSNKKELNNKDKKNMSSSQKNFYNLNKVEEEDERASNPYTTFNTGVSLIARLLNNNKTLATKYFSKARYKENAKTDSHRERRQNSEEKNIFDMMKENNISF